MESSGNDCSAEGNSLLVIIVDTNKVWWGDQRPKGQISASAGCLSRCMDAVMGFANCFLLLSNHNELAIIAAHDSNSSSRFLYPPQAGYSAPVNPADNKEEACAKMNAAVKEHLVRLLDQESSTLFPDSVLTGALSLAMCYINKKRKQMTRNRKLHSKILIIKGADDNPDQYMNFINCVFTAQKLDILIDGCVLYKDSGLVQQACDITGGTYLKLPTAEGLMQCLMCIFLADAVAKPLINLPPAGEVDYRAACFCHRSLIQVGFVCSVCLSVYCGFSPICNTCQTTFKLSNGPLRKKMRKNPPSLPPGF